LEESRLLQVLHFLSSRSASKEHSYEHEQVEDVEDHEEVEESLSLEDREKELIQKALDKHHGKRNMQRIGIGYFRAYAIPKNQRIRLKRMKISITHSVIFGTFFILLSDKYFVQGQFN
jgi:hypothetical protein